MCQALTFLEGGAFHVMCTVRPLAVSSDHTWFPIRINCKITYPSPFPFKFNGISSGASETVSYIVCLQTAYILTFGTHALLMAETTEQNLLCRVQL